jgi:enamine deaminase RidA (YjgF/YER057c/UK114 family)
MQRLRIRLPDLLPTHEFVPVNVIGDLAFVSGHAPFDRGEFLYRGKIGRELDLQAGKCAAQSAVLGCLASLQSALASLDKITGIVKLNGYVNCTPEFHDLPLITDAASRLLVSVFGESAGTHAQPWAFATCRPELQWRLS